MKKAVRVICFITVCFLWLSAVYEVLRWKDTHGDYISSVTELKETPANTVDVVFVGSSHVYAGIYPSYMWSDWGISAFNVSISGMDRDSAYYYMKHIDSIRCRKDEVNYYIDCNPSLTQFWLNVFVAGTDDKVQKHITVYMIDKCPSKWMELKEKYDKKQRQYFIQGQQMIKNGEKLIAEGKELCKEDKMLFYMGDSVIQDFAHTLYTCNNNK